MGGILGKALASVDFTRERSRVMVMDLKVMVGVSPHLFYVLNKRKKKKIICFGGEKREMGEDIFSRLFSFSMVW